MPYDEPADLIGSAEATLDTIALLLGDIGEEVQDTPGAWTIAEILRPYRGPRAVVARGDRSAAISPGSAACAARKIPR